MRVLGVIGLLAAVAIILVAMVVVGRGVAGGAGAEAPAVKTGADKAYDDLKKDGDMDDPKDVMRGALKGDL
jgi:Tfp pilus assembly major pilin PilA